MKRIILTLSALLLAITAFTGVLWTSKGKQTVNVRFNIKDYPEHGVRIVGPTDPSFERMISAYMKGQVGRAAELSKAFSVFISNSGPRTVVAYKVKWELLRSDGRSLTHTESYAEPGLLMGRQLSNHPAQSDERSYLIRPNSNKLVSWVTALAEPTRPSPSQEPGGEEAMNQLNSQLLSATDLTVSIDGIFFEDGTFVGQNSTGYYEQIDAQVRAKRDLLDSIAQGDKKPAELDEAFSSIERESDAEDVRINYDSTPDDIYKLYKRLFAKELAGMKRAYGKEKTVAHARELRNKSWPKLKKE